MYSAIRKTAAAVDGIRKWKPEERKSYMKIHVEMTEAEMQDFLQYRKEKGNRQAEKNRLKIMSQSVLFAIEPDPNEKGKFIIADHDHAEDLLEMAGMYAG